MAQTTKVGSRSSPRLAAAIEPSRTKRTISQTCGIRQSVLLVCFGVIAMCPLYLCQIKVDRAFNGGPDHEVLVNAFNASLTRRDLKVIDYLVNQMITTDHPITPRRDTPPSRTAHPWLVSIFFTVWLLFLSFFLQWLCFRTSVVVMSLPSRSPVTETETHMRSRNR